MTPPINNRPATMIVNRNLASTIKNYIASQENGKKISEKDVSIILGRMAEVNEARNKDNDPTNDNSIFKGGSKYAGGSGRANFLVNQGQKIDFNASEYNKIFGGYLEKMSTINIEEFKETPKETNKAKESSANSPKIAQNNVSIKLTTDQIKHSQKRSVDGEKQNIIEIKGEDGTKKMHLVNDDGTLGEELIKQTGGSMFGHATYVTKSKVDAQVRGMLHLADNQSIPEGINPKYEQDANGNPQLVLTDAKGNRLDSNTIKDLLAKNTEAPKEQAAPQKTVVLGKMEFNAEAAKELMTSKAKAKPEAKPAHLQNVNNYMQAAKEQVQPKNEDLIKANPENLQDEDTSMYT